MAKKKSAVRTNKSAAIRSYKAENPDSSPQGIATAHAKERVKVSAAFVSTILSNDRRKLGVRAQRGPRAEASVENLLQAKKLADQMGGIGPAKAALEALAKLLS